MKTTIDTPLAPAAIGPYSQAAQDSGLLFVSGQLGIDPSTGAIVEGGSAIQARRSLENIVAILEAAGLDTSSVLKTTVYLTDINDFAAVNEVYAEFFSAPYPARAAFAVAALPKGASVEIECVASVSSRPQGQ